jgi:hypothetical protein
MSTIEDLRRTATRWPVEAVARFLGYSALAYLALVLSAGVGFMVFSHVVTPGAALAPVKNFLLMALGVWLPAIFAAAAAVGTTARTPSLRGDE